MKTEKKKGGEDPHGEHDEHMHQSAGKMSCACGNIS